MFLRTVHNITPTTTKITIIRRKRKRYTFVEMMMMKHTIIICTLQLIFNLVGLNALILDSSSSSTSLLSNVQQQQQSAPLALTASGASNLGSNSGGGGGGGGGFGSNGGGLGILEQNIAAVFSKVAYGSTTTKRSIPDNVFIPSLTTVPTPIVTTNRYREKDKDQQLQQPTSSNDNNNHQQQINAHHRNYELDLERDHALPTSAPNAEILKSNNNPTYPNPNRHHYHDRHRHPNSTPYPIGHNLRKNNNSPTIPMHSSGDMPSYSPPSRTHITPALPRDYANPFADKPTLRGTNSDIGLINTGQALDKRRPIPPPSLNPSHERIPYRPPDLVGGSPSNGNGGAGTSPQQPSIQQQQQQQQQQSLNEQDNQRKKALNTPSEKLNRHNNYNNNNGANMHSPTDLGASLASSSSLNASANNDLNISSPGLSFPGIHRILSGSNGRNEELPEMLFRGATSRPSILLSAYPSLSPFPASDSKQLGAANNNDNGDDDNNNDDDNDSEDFDIFAQPKIKQQNESNSMSAGTSIQSTTTAASAQTPTTSTALPMFNVAKNINANSPSGGGSAAASAATKTTSSSSSSSTSSSSSSSSSSSIPTWTIAWNIHVYLSAILFTVLAVYSIFKMIFYDKLTHLFNQSYFISIHLILIIICLTRIFYLCYDAYNIHMSFHIFISELLLNIPSTLLTIIFSILILFLLIKSINYKQNRYSSIIRPITVIIISSVHIGLCITLHYVENYSQQQQLQMQLHHQQQYNTLHLHQQQQQQSAAIIQQQQILKLQQQQQLQPTLLMNNNVAYGPPRILSLICQIIYIFICFSLGILYLYIYRLLKRILHNKSQNYIHGYHNLTYAIHITIATALLFILLGILQIYGAFSITRVRPFVFVDMNWLQWGYQFSLRLIEIAIIILISWVTGLKTGTNNKILQQHHHEHHHHDSLHHHHHHHHGGSGGGGSVTGGHHQQNITSGFALFPCTSLSSQENFDTDYPAICSANTNLHTYTMRTGKPIYDDNFPLNSLNLEQTQIAAQQQQPAPRALNNDFQLINSNEFTRSYETNSIRSSITTGPGGGIVGVSVNPQHIHPQHSERIMDDLQHQTPTHLNDDDDDFLNDSGTIPDHYENPNFELRHQQQQQNTNQNPNNANDLIIDNGYSEPLNVVYNGSGGGGSTDLYDFQNFERPNFEPSQQQQHATVINPNAMQPQPIGTHSITPNARNEFRASKNLKALKNNNTNYLDHHQQQQQQHHHNQQQYGRTLGASNTLNNSFERRGGGIGGVRKSGTLNNIGGIHYNGNGGGGRSSNNSTSSGSSTGGGVNNRQIGGLQTSKSSHDQSLRNERDMQRNTTARLSNSKKDRSVIDGSSTNGGKRSSLERNTNITTNGYHMSGQQDEACDSDNYYNMNHMQLPPPSHHHQNSSGGDSTNSGSMLVAEQGFVRFRALEDIGLRASQQQLHHIHHLPPSSSSSSASNMEHLHHSAAPTTAIGTTTRTSIRSNNKDKRLISNS